MRFLLNSRIVLIITEYNFAILSIYGLCLFQGHAYLGDLCNAWTLVKILSAPPPRSTINFYVLNPKKNVFLEEILY